MRSLPLLIACVLVAPAAGADSPTELESRAKPLLQKYCLGCHNEQKSQGELNLTAIAAAGNALQSRNAWVHVQTRLSRQEMPPEDAPQPTAAESEWLQRWTAEIVRRIDAATPPSPGRVTMRRLNRAEYRNTLRDLLGVTFDLTFDPTRDFPADGAGYGFDTIGDVQTVSPLHLEKYLAAAAQILARALVIDGLDGPRTWTFAAQDLRVVSPTRPPDAAGMWPTNWVAEVDVQQPGEYRIKAVLRSETDNRRQAQMAIQIDGRSPERFTHTRQAQVSTIERKITLTESGPKQVWVAYLHEQNKPLFEPDDAAHGNLVVESLEISGPYLDLTQLPASHTRLIISRPDDDRARSQAAADVLTAFLPRAFRRPVAKDEVQQYVALFEKADQPAQSFEAALLAPLKAALVSPHFLYRVEVDRAAQDGSYPLNSSEMACRLSYFLWSSMPDEELFRRAADGSLTDPQVLEAQARRMLADPKSTSLSENFVSQWLQLRGLDTFQPDRKTGQIGTRLRIGMTAEPVMIFHEVLTGGRPLTDLIETDFTFANEELARLYKLPPAPEHDSKQPQQSRDRMLRYALPADARRGGLMTTAAVLTATSHPDRTSPVKRGKWVLDALLGTPPPPPPPDVAALDETPEAKGKLSLRQRLEAHRTQAACASCHKRMDPLGFAFEHYDALGRWRENDGNQAVDATATLPDGKTLDGVPGLKAHLLAEKEAFAHCLTEKLLTYALGRGVEPFDARAVREIVAATQADDHRLARIVVGIVTSHPFRSRSLPGTEPPAIASPATEP